MFDFTPDRALPKEELYAELLAAADGVTQGEPDSVANMANVAALLWQFLPDCNWTGFYRVIGSELVLGPFCGNPACIRIPLGVGVCGVAAQSGESQLVKDVRAFPGHIACDGETQSELVVPIIRADSHGTKTIAVIDLDSPLPARFDEQDQAGIEALARLLATRI